MIQENKVSFEINGVQGQDGEWLFFMLCKDNDSYITTMKGKLVSLMNNKGVIIYQDEKMHS